MRDPAARRKAHRRGRQGAAAAPTFRPRRSRRPHRLPSSSNVSTCWPPMPRPCAAHVDALAGQEVLGASAVSPELVLCFLPSEVGAVRRAACRSGPAGPRLCPQRCLGLPRLAAGHAEVGGVYLAAGGPQGQRARDLRSVPAALRAAGDARRARDPAGVIPEELGRAVQLVRRDLGVEGAAHRPEDQCLRRNGAGGTHGACCLGKYAPAAVGPGTDREQGSGRQRAGSASCEAAAPGNRPGPRPCGFSLWGG